jgi:hypothetical protein
MAEQPLRVTMAQLVRRVHQACREQGRQSRICPECRDAIRAQARADALWAVCCAMKGYVENLEALGGTDNA